MLFAATLALLAAPFAAALQSLEVQGKYFVNPNDGKRFQIVGVDYQPGGSAGYKPELGEDPLANPEACLRDAALMQVLGVNTIRVYNLSPDLNHDECVSIFNAAGMYMAIDVNAPPPGESLTSFEPWTSYYAAYLNRTFAIIEGFKNYPNTLLFFASNEIINDLDSGEFAPRYVRALTRDLKNYIKLHSDRYIPVGYSAADVREILYDSWNYFTCAIEGEEDDESRGDLFALNSYSWCGDSDFKKSTYEELVDNLDGTSVPIFFSEYGCNEDLPRLFTEVQAIYGDEMTGVFSGGLVYEYTQEENNYGLVKINEDGSADLLRDFNTLAEQYKKLDFDKIQGEDAADDTPEPAVCEEKLITNDGFDSNFTIPEIPTSDDSADILEAGVSPAPVGQLVEITDFKVKLEVRDVKGNVIEGLEVKPRDTPNRPGSNAATDTSVVADGSGDEEDAGAFVQPSIMAAMGIPLLALLF